MTQNKRFVPTPAQLMAASRRRAASAQTAGGPPAVMLDSGYTEQGPTQAGGTLAGITAPGRATTILGPIFRPRSTGANPLTSDPFKETSGVGGFFRRLLGDNADELNAQWQQYRIASQLAAQNEASKRAFELEKINLADQLAGAREAAGREFTKELQGQQQGFQMGQAINKEIADAADREAQQEFIKGQNLQRDIFATLRQESDNAQRMKEIEAQGNTALDRTLLSGKDTVPDWKHLGEGVFRSPEGSLNRIDPETGRMLQIEQGAPTPDAPSGPTAEQRSGLKRDISALRAAAAQPIDIQGPPSPEQQFESKMSGLAYADQPALEQEFARSALARAEFAPAQVGWLNLYREPESALEARTPSVMKQFNALPTETQMDIYRSALSGIEDLSPAALREKSKKAQIKPIFQFPFTTR